MEPYYINYLNKETANHSEYSFAHCHWRHMRYKHFTLQNNVLPMVTHLKLFATQPKQLTQTQTHFSHDLNAHSNSPGIVKLTIFHNNEHTNIISNSDIIPDYCKENPKQIYTTIISQYLNSRKNNKITNTTSYDLYT